MLARSLTRVASRSLAIPRAISVSPNSSCRLYQTMDKEVVADEQEALLLTAADAQAKSCYNSIDWKISEDAKVIEMLKLMVANKIGALAVTDGEDKVVGIVSERDYLSKVAFLGKTSDTTTVKEICTHGISNLVTVTAGNPIDRCMEKMLGRDVRHLLIRDKKYGGPDTNIIGIISIKDIVKCSHEKTKAQMNRLEDLVLVHDITSKV
mmetsp:Transcript_21526/g.42962  ORF Transcript_21526/g.42962 Transcript_21526/m.42962 type:complete len:208 (-) Transcript_21526:84-707(-)